MAPAADDAAVLYEKTPEGVAVLRLNRPDNMNAWSNEIALGLFDGYDRATADADVKVIVVTGNGRAFCAGADMKGGKGLESLARGRSAEKDAELAAGFVNDPKGRPFNHANRVPKPIIAAVNGACAGMGLTQVLACDVRFAAEGAKFTSAFVRRGLIAEGGISASLPRLIGTGGAMDVLLSGRVLSAEEARQAGIVQRLFPRESLLEEVMKYATDMAINCPVSSMSVIKQQVLRHQLIDQEAALRESNLLMMATAKGGSGSPDTQEGIRAFVQKRAPRFSAFDPESPLQRLKRDVLPPVGDPEEARRRAKL